MPPRQVHIHWHIGDAWEEARHPRGSGGRFGSGSKSSAGVIKTGVWHGAELTSSQHYRDDDIVEAKRAAKDYGVSVSPQFKVNGQKYRAVIDGHHSLEAAMLDGVDPEFTEFDATDDDRIGLLRDPEAFLEAMHMGDDYQNPVTKNSTF